MTGPNRTRRLRSGLAALALLAFSLSSRAAWAYDLEFDAGARAGSGDPSALGAASWYAVDLSGPFAFGTSGTGEVSLAATGIYGVDGALGGDASYSKGATVGGLRLDAAALRSPETGEDSLSLSMSAPFTLNGSVLSLSFAPSYGKGFYDDESVSFGAQFSLTYLAGDFVLKPGAAVKRTLFTDDAETLEISPSVGFVWYPGIPVSADLSLGWTRSETDSGDVATSYPVAVSISAVPRSWLCLTGRFESAADVSGFMSYRADAEVELIKYGERGTAFHFPIAGYYSWDEDGTERFGVSLMVGFSFGDD